MKWVTNTQEIRKELYNQSREERRRYGHGRSLVTRWEHNVHPQWLYKLACKKAGKASLKDDEIIPTVFGDGSMELFRESARSEYWFWEIVSNLSLVEKVSALSVQRAIDEIRVNHTRMIYGVAARLENLTPAQAVRLTAYGAILWDEDTDSYIANPLWP